MAGGGEGQPAEDKMRLITSNIEITVEVDEVEVKGRLVGLSEQAKIREQNFVIVKRKIVDDKGVDSVEERMILDTAAFGKQLFCATITGLGDNAVDMDGNPLMCDDQTKGDIYEYNGDFAEKVMKKITAEIKQMRSGELKNLKPGASGTSNQAGQAAKSAKKKN